MHDDLRRSLGGIVNDLWGTSSPAASKAAPAEKISAGETAAFPPFEQLWSSVDETVDWTEVLAHDAPTDGLTSPESWALYRQHASKVLAGNAEAYLDVLKAADPLKDLTPWAEKFDVTCVNSDTLRVKFTALPALVQSEGQRYIAGMSLRAVRDLFALLPVLQVEVSAVCEGKPLLTVSFERSELQKVRFGFIDPVTFALSCGGTFSK